MWKCKFCQLEFEFNLEDKSKKANHTRWCHSNPKSKEYRDKAANQLPSGWNAGLNKNNDPRVSKISEGVKRHLKNNDPAFKGKSHSIKTREKISMKMVGNTNGNHRGDRQSYHNGIRMDSSWEVRVAEYLDKHNISWKYGEIVYQIDETHSYRPDFVLEDGSIIEVKGFWWPDNKAKFEEWRQKYPNIKVEIWNKEKLKELNLI